MQGAPGAGTAEQKQDVGAVSFACLTQISHRWKKEKKNSSFFASVKAQNLFRLKKGEGANVLEYVII